MTSLRMLLKAYGVRVVAGLVAALGLLIIADLTDVAPYLAARPDGLRLGVELYLYKAPGLALQALPLAILFGTLLTVAALARSGELLAFRASGAGPLRLAFPGLAVAAVLSVVGAWAANGPVPRTERAATRIGVRTLGRWTYTWTIFHKRRSWYAGHGSTLYHVGRIEDGGRTLVDVTRYDVTGGRFRRLATADRLTWDGDRWRDDGVRVWRFASDPRKVSVAGGPLPMAVAPRYFGGVLGEPAELTGAELDKAIALRRQQGQPVVAMVVERSSRRALALLGLALAVLALGLSLRVPPPGAWWRRRGWASPWPSRAGPSWPWDGRWDSRGSWRRG